MLIRVIDLETGGFAPPHMPCEAAYTDVVSVGPGNYIIGKQNSTLLNPGIIMNRDAINTHGITHEMVKDAPSAKYASNFFHWETQIDYIVAHNWKFESQWIESREAKPVCTLICAKHVFSSLRSYKNYEIFKALKCNETADMSLCEPLHRALPDTYITAHILLRLLEKATIDELVAITAGKPIDTILPFGKFKGCKIDDPIVDMGYLEYLMREPWVSSNLKGKVSNEMERRKAEGWKPKT